VVVLGAQLPWLSRTPADTAASSRRQRVAGDSPTTGSEVGIPSQARDREFERPRSGIREAEHEGEVGDGERCAEVVVLKAGGEAAAGPPREGGSFSVCQDEELVAATAPGVRVAIGVDPEEDPTVRAELHGPGEPYVDGEPSSNGTDRDLRDVGRVACVADRVRIDGGGRGMSSGGRPDAQGCEYGDCGRDEHATDGTTQRHSALRGCP